MQWFSLLNNYCVAKNLTLAFQIRPKIHVQILQKKQCFKNKTAVKGLKNLVKWFYFTRNDSNPYNKPTTEPSVWRRHAILWTTRICHNIQCKQRARTVVSNTTFYLHTQFAKQILHGWHSTIAFVHSTDLFQLTKKLPPSHQWCFGKIENSWISF